MAALDVPLEDAVEAEATAMLLSENPLGDQIDSLWLSFPVKDVRSTRGGFLDLENWPCRPRWIRPRWPRTRFRRKPPSGCSDRATPESAEGLALDGIPCMLGRALLFGRQTDREARLEVVGVARTNLERLRTMLAEIGDGELADDPEEEVLAQGCASRELLERPWRLPPDVTREQFDSLSEAYFDRAILETWPQTSLGLFDGKSPEQVAGDETLPGSAVGGDHAPRDLGQTG